MAPAAVRSKAVVLLLFIHCLLLPLLFVGVQYFVFILLAVLISLRKRKLVILLLLRSECHVTVIFP